ncbi:MAG: anhydro-N-acetylmuramic acid kinase [Gammaproteobacteria bacterium]|jgi:anhydro-N-acetylmuramic acid kinase
MAEMFIGLMSGTSVDAVDAALVDFSGPFPALVASCTYPIEPDLRHALLALAEDRIERAIDRLGELDVTVAERFAAAVRQLLADAGVPASEVTAIGSHGQTVRHRPTGPAPFTLQIGDPNIIAERTGITTVADFRRRDLAAGGQGAPLAPAFHAAVFRSEQEDRVVVNVGGMANITILPADRSAAVSGFDTGPGNALLDAWIGRHRDAPFDRDGAWAADGRIWPELLERLLAEPYFAADPPKSTGREQFHLRWVDAALAELENPRPAIDVQTTLCALTAQTIAAAIERHAPAATRVLICGGGAYNGELMRRLDARLGSRTVETTAAYGVAPEWVEAVAFAWLARQTLAGRPGNLPSVTGARAERVLGAIYRGS